MKILLLILLVCSTCISAPVVEVVNLDTVRIDGIIQGDVTTATLSNTKLAPDIQAALAVYFKSNLVAVADAQAQLALTQPLRNLLAKAQEALAAGDFDSLKAILTPAVDDAKRTEKQRIIDEKTKVRDVAQADLDAAIASPDATKAAALKAAKPAPAKPATPKPVKPSAWIEEVPAPILSEKPHIVSQPAVLKWREK